jgi:hypothetical protein
LIKIFSFKIRPDTVKRLELRRHHSTRQIMSIEHAPLGFPVETIRSRRS